MHSISELLINQWKEMKGELALSFYFENILPLVVTNIQERAKHAYAGEPPGQWDSLVSLMGYSPETTVIATAAVRPRKRLIMVTSDNTLPHYDLVLGTLTRMGILKPHQIQHEVITPDDPRQIYDAVTSSIQKTQGNTLVDVTGGKKIMSATAAQAAWELNARLCYIDGDYDPVLRRPTPGSERLIVLFDPSQERGRQARSTALQAWKMHQYTHAAELFRISMNQNHEHHLEELAIPLSKTYAALSDFRLATVSQHVEELEEVAMRPYLARLLNNTGIAECLDVLSQDPLLEKTTTRIAAFLSLASSYADQHRFDFASLLAYRAMEASVEDSLRKSGSGDFNPSAANYDALGVDIADLQHRYASLSCKTDSRSEMEQMLPRRLGLMNGFCILILLNPKLVQNIFPDAPNIDIVDAVKRVRGISDIRNRSILAHGTTSLTFDDYGRISELAHSLANALYPGGGISDLKGKLRPPKLDILLK